MIRVLVPAARLVDRLFIRPGSAGDDHHRRLYLASLILLFLPVGAYMTWEDLAAGRTVEAAWIIGLVGPLALSLLVLRLAEDIRWGYRLVAATVLPSLTGLLATGAGEGYAFVWWFFVPAGLFYVFGSREGMAWFVAFFAGAAVGVSGGVGARYPAAVQLRFLLAYAVLGGLALAMERSRRRLITELAEEKAELERALAEVSTLAEMIPMCAWCGKVRDDEGYWSRIEHYLRTATGTTVSHALCPSCETKMVEGDPDADLLRRERHEGRP